MRGAISQRGWYHHLLTRHILQLTRRRRRERRGQPLRRQAGTHIHASYRRHRRNQCKSNAHKINNESHDVGGQSMLQSRRADPRYVDTTGDERPEIAARADGDGILELADEQDTIEVRMVDGFQSEEQVHGRW